MTKLLAEDLKQLKFIPEYSHGIFKIQVEVGHSNGNCFV